MISKKALRTEIVSSLREQGLKVIEDKPCEPFIRWIGGKRRMVKYIEKGLPTYKWYVEPFLGGGGVFFGMRHYNKAFLHDNDPWLINLYIQVRDKPLELILAIKRHAEKNSKEYFMKVRETVGKGNADGVKQAAQLFYILQAGFNGDYRFNKDGNCITGFAGVNNFRIGKSLDKKILEASKKLAGHKISQSDFLQHEPVRDALYYLDPPYVDRSVKYNCIFGKKEWIKLWSICNKIHQKGSYFIVSHITNPFIDNLFSRCNKEYVPHEWSMGLKGEKRGEEKAKECLYRNF